MGAARLARGRAGRRYEELVETDGRPRLRYWLDRFQTDGLVEAGVVYGYFPAVSEGDDLVVLGDDGRERERFTFPRQRRDRHLCLADFFRPAGSGQLDVVGFQLVTVGTKISRATAELFAKDAYRDYLELHGLSVQLTEALAEYWHGRVRAELGLAGFDPARAGGHPQGRIPRLPVLVRLPGLSRPGRPGQGRAAAAAGTDRGEPVRGVPARPRAVHRRADRPSPRGKVFQHLSGGLLRAVLFDMDGLLVDSEPLWFEAECAVMATMGGSWTRADQLELTGGSLEHSVGYMRARALRPAEPALVGTWLLLDTMATLIADRGVPLMPGAAGLLAELTAAGIPLALVTSAQRQIMDAVIARADLAFGTTVCAEDVSHSKPAPDPVPAGGGTAGAAAPPAASRWRTHPGGSPRPRRRAARSSRCPVCRCRRRWARPSPGGRS